MMKDIYFKLFMENNLKALKFIGKIRIFLVYNKYLKGYR